MRGDTAKARAKAKRLGFSEGGYADGPHGESKHGWIDPDGNVLDVADMLAYTPPDHARNA